MRLAKMKAPEILSTIALRLHALANSIPVRTPIDAKVVILFHEAALRSESLRH